MNGANAMTTTDEVVRADSTAADPVTVRLFLSWCHKDQKLKDQLVGLLTDGLAILKDVQVKWWEDSHLHPGEELRVGVEAAIAQADYGLLLLSPAYFASTFIRGVELPRFVSDGGSAASKGAVPVALRSLPGINADTWDYGGVNKLLIYFYESKAFSQLRGSRRDEFANGLVEKMRRRFVGDGGYRAL
jgi:hypothetical protein